MVLPLSWRIVVLFVDRWFQTPLLVDGCPVNLLSSWSLDYSWWFVHADYFLATVLTLDAHDTNKLPTTTPQAA